MDAREEDSSHDEGLKKEVIGGKDELNHQLPDQPTEKSDGSQVRESLKFAHIAASCGDPVDVAALTSLATSEYGLMNDELRQKAWPAILGCHDYSASQVGQIGKWQDLPRHRDENQVELDVNRSFIYYPKNLSESELKERKLQLLDLIVQVLREHPMLCYFQGFHDIAQVFLLVLGRERAGPTLAHVALLRIRDFMLPSLNPSLAHLQLLPAILGTVDPVLNQHLSSTRPYFALASTLTMYAHEIQEYSDIARLYDFLLAQPAILSVYFFAVIILSRKNELLEIRDDEPEILHVVLSKLPKPLDLEGLISQATELFKTNPPESLPWFRWWTISAYSVLKTTTEDLSTQTLQEGELLFRKQAAQLRREEIRTAVLSKAWKFRRPGGIGLAILVGVLAISLRRGGLEGFVGLGWLRSLIDLKFWGGS